MSYEREVYICRAMRSLGDKAMFWGLDRGKQRDSFCLTVMLSRGDSLFALCDCKTRSQSLLERAPGSDARARWRLRGRVRGSG
jgi:hypothetical protein